jgi:putative oxidoreductase
MALFPAPIDLASLLLRLFLGAIMMVHGFPKLFRAEGRAQTMGFMKGVGVPPALALAAGVLEFFGGLALVLGFLAQVAALLILLEMAGTTLLSWRKLGKKLVLGYELDLAYLFMALALVLVGPGIYSLDRALGVAVQPLWLAIAAGLAIAFAALTVGLRVGAKPVAAEGKAERGS